MPWWEAILDSLAVLAVLLLVGFVALFVRRRWLGRSGGVFECSIRTKIPKNSRAPRGWKLGVGRYSGDQTGVVPHLLVLAAPAARARSTVSGHRATGAARRRGVLAVPGPLGGRGRARARHHRSSWR